MGRSTGSGKLPIDELRCSSGDQKVMSAAREDKGQDRICHVDVRKQEPISFLESAVITGRASLMEGLVDNARCMILHLMTRSHDCVWAVDIKKRSGPYDGLFIDLFKTIYRHKYRRRLRSKAVDGGREERSIRTKIMKRSDFNFSTVYLRPARLSRTTGSK